MEDQENPVTIVEVWSHNLEFEFSRIASTVPYFLFLSMDTEFPGGVVHPKADSTPRSSQNYRALKANIDSLQLIQLGITLSDLQGNLPDFGGSCHFVWQFNFKEFDVARDLHALDSIKLRRQQGIDFEKNKGEGIDSSRFYTLMFSSVLIFYNTRLLQWITFHGAYDFAYLLKIITRRPLPETLGGFYNLIRIYFGLRIYDVKEIITYCDGVFGGLELVAKTYGLKRITGNAHRTGNANRAGSDSLLTWSVFQKILNNKKVCVKGVGVLYGLQIDLRPTPLKPITRGPLLHPHHGVLHIPGILVVIGMGSG